MNKFPIIAILALFVLVVSVSAVPNFEFVEDSVGLSGQAGQTLNLDFDIKNTASEDISINFSDFTLSDGANQLAISSLDNITNLLSGSTQNIDFSVVIPSDQVIGTYIGNLKGTSNLSDTDTVTINVNVIPTYKVGTISDMDLGTLRLNSTRTRSFIVTNTGNAGLTNVTFTFSDSDFILQTDKTNFGLAVDATELIQFNLTVPADFSTGNITLGTMKLVSTELSSDLFDVRATIGGGLIIEDLDVFLTTRDSESGSHLDVLDGKKLNFDPEEVGPESELRFNFNIENTFTDDDDIEVNDVSVKVTIIDIDDGDDLEEESTDIDINTDTNEDIDVFVIIPLSVDQGIYDIFIEVEGRDDNSNIHTVEMRLKLDIDKDAREVIVAGASVFPDTIKCSGTATVSATIKNLGKRIEDEAKITIINEDLGIFIEQRDIELEEDPFDDNNEFTKKLSIAVERGTSAGTYPIQIGAYIEDDILWETKTVNLVVLFKVFFHNLVQKLIFHQPIINLPA